jgi:hypothetical protein
VRVQTKLLTGMARGKLAARRLFQPPSAPLRSLSIRHGERSVCFAPSGALYACMLTRMRVPGHRSSLQHLS